MASENVPGLKLTVTMKGSVASTTTPGLVQQVDYTYEINFTDGTGSNQIGTIYQHLAKPLNATTETIDLDSLPILGATQTDPTAVKALLLRHRSTTSGELMKAGGGDFAASTGPVADATDKIVTGPNGLILIVNPIDGWGITASTKDGLLVELTGNSSYDVIALLDNT